MERPVVGSCRVFVGRGRELSQLDGLVRGALGGRAAAVVVAGEAGIGKTELLQEAAERARPARVLTVRGVESEAVLAFSAAADLLLPLRQHFAHLPDVQREALEVGLALRAGPSGSELAACAGALGVLAAASDEQPILVIVDDLQWVDPASRRILLFVARRLATERVALVFAQREPTETDELPLDLRVLQLHGLPYADVAALVRRLGLDVRPDVLVRLVEQTGGNPLVITETVTAGVAGDPSVDTPQLGSTIGRAWGAVLDVLPPATALALKVVALSRSDEVSDLRPVLHEMDVDVVDLGNAQRRGLLQVRAGHVVLRHPLLRSVVRERTTQAECVQIHRVLARHASGHLGAFYLASTTTGPNDAIADTLAGGAVELRARHDYRTSAIAWGRAAELTVDPARRGSRFLAAATDAYLSGGLRDALGWCTRATADSDDALLTADIELVRARAMVWLGYPGPGIDVLLHAAHEIAPIDADRASRLFAEAVLPCSMAGRIDDMVRTALLSQEVGVASLQVAACAAFALVLGGRFDEARRTLAELDVPSEHAVDAWDLQSVTEVIHARLFLQDFAEAEQLLSNVIGRARRVGSPAVLAINLSLSCELRWWKGNWAIGYADGTEALQWAEELHQAGNIGYTLVCLARIDAARGDRATCHRRLDRARGETVPFGVDCLDVYIPAVLGLDALSAGEAETAAAHLGRAWRHAVADGLACPSVVPFVGDLVEAYLQTGDQDGAAAACVWLDGCAAPGGPDYSLAVRARCRGLLARDPATVQRHFAEARELYERSSPMPFEQARTLLAEGRSLRRCHRPTLARRPLREALAIFEGLGARPWVAQTANELGAAGAPRAMPLQTTSGIDALTPQEFQIARMVASGLSNVETAAALFISRKTVEAHLSRVYRKLTLRSRAHLARVFVESGNV